MAKEWQRVVFAVECSEDGDCPACLMIYDDCKCIGPTEDGVEYKFEDGVMYGRRRG